MKKYLISKDEQLTSDKLGKILQEYQTKELPRLIKYWKYYVGNQDINKKQPTDVGKPNNRLCVNYCKNITDNFMGYLTGIPVTYENDDLQDVLDILNYNDYNEEDSELLKQCLIFSKAFELNYVDEEGKQRFKYLDSRECVPIYYNDLNGDLAYVIRFWEEDLVDSTVEQNYRVEVYGNDKTSIYKSSAGFVSFTLTEEKPNYFGQVPVTVMELNSDGLNIFDQIISLQDGYNVLVSGQLDDYQSWVDSYLVLQGAFADNEELNNMKEHKVLMLPDGCDAKFVTKNSSDNQVKDILENLNQQIYKVANCVDFSDTTRFGTSSGIAIRYLLLNFEFAASNIASRLKKALQRRIELICSILKLTGGEDVWRDVKITINRNIPTDLANIANEVNGFRGLVSDRTLLTQIPFVTDIDEELKQLEEEKEESMKLYSMDFNSQNEDEEIV